MSLGCCEQDDFATIAGNRKKKVNLFSFSFLGYILQAIAAFVVRLFWV